MSANQKQQCELNDYAIRYVRRKARQLARTEGFAAQDIEDIRQDLIVDLLERLPKFDPSKATCNMFVARIIDRKIAALIRDRNCAKRDPWREECSLNECIDDGEGGSVERIQTIAADETDRWLGRQARPDQETAELALDVEEVLKRLPDNLRRLCEFLKTGSIADAARAMGVPRTTLHAHIKKLREVFKAAGLCDYL